ncbi:MAG TPA: D-alanine--D-alanine ligase family protein [Terriglobia bacterium]|nr:D-alanine--D-alanine ligase family protein [Terriglobia bacterium]
MPKKIRLGILFGGRSGEHEVSLESAASILKAIDREKYDVVPIGITREGRWVLGSGPAELSPKALAGVLQNGRAIAPPADPTRRGLTPLAAPSRGIKDHAALDVVFPVLHGTFGEDGTVQGLLDLAGIPYVGAGVLGSATGMDKDVMKRLFRDAGLPVVPWILLLRSELIAHPARTRQQVAREIGYPAFVKPANLGSSVGISKVRDPQELRAAIELAAKFDRKIIVEKAIDAREIECAVLGNDAPQASVPGEIVPVNEFYDYQAKYVKEGSRLIIPAKLSAARTRKVQQLALRAFKAIDCAGMGRVDFLMDRQSGKLYVNEINTIPGFTSISMYPKLWEASGMPYAKLIDRLVELAIERHRDKSRTQYDYKKLGP